LITRPNAVLAAKAAKVKSNIEKHLRFCGLLLLRRWSFKNYPGFRGFNVDAVSKRSGASI
jgi:hypothetical protein